MKTKRSLIALVGAMVLGSSALAEEVQSKTTAPLQTIFPKSYGIVELRHYLEKKREGNDTKREPTMQARYYLGSKFLEDKLDTYFIFGVNKQASSTVMKQRSTEFGAEYTLFKNEFLTVIPWTDIRFPFEQYGTNGKLDLYTQLQYEQTVNAGKFTVGTSYDIAMLYGSRPGPDQVAVTEGGRPVDSKTVKELGLNVTQDTEDNNTYKTYQDVPSYKTEYTVYTSFEPAAVKGLNLMLKSYHYHTLTPVMEVDRETKRVATKRKGSLNQPVYNAKYSFDHAVQVKYDITGTTYVANEFYLKPREEGVRQYMNLLYFGAKLF